MTIKNWKSCALVHSRVHMFFLLAFCHIEPSALRIRFFWSHHSNFFSKAPLKKVKTPTSFFCSRGCNDLNFFSQTMIFFDLKIFQYGESLTTEKISLGHKFRPLFLLLWDEWGMNLSLVVRHNQLITYIEKNHGFS